MQSNPTNILEEKEKILSTIKVKIYTNPEKQQLLKQALGNVRFVWNKLLEKNIDLYKKEKKFIFFFDMCKEMKNMKKEYPFLKQSPSQTLQQVARKLDRSLQDGIKRKRGFPKFKKKSRYKGVLIFPQGFRVDGRSLYLPKVGWIKIKDKITKKPEWENIKESTKQVWVKEEVNGFFAYIAYERQKEIKESNGKMVGVDVGIKNTITTNNGNVLSLDTKKIMTLAKKVEILQSAIDKKKNINKERDIKHSNRIEALKIKKYKILKKIKNIKSDFYYKAANCILNSHEYVAVEDLNLKELKETKKDNKIRNNINRYLHQITLSEFFRILDWKAELYGRKIIKINPENTSKTCSNCEHINYKMQLKDRVFCCPECRLKIDRDVNAATNIFNRGLKLIASSVGHIEYTREMVAMQPIRRTSNASSVKSMSEPSLQLR